MKNRPRPRESGRDTMSLAGWLFADLLLGLAMLFFVFNTVGSEPAPAAQATNTPTPTPTATATPTTTPTPRPGETPTKTPTPTFTPEPTPTPAIGLVQEPFVYVFKINGPALLGRAGSGAAAQRAQAAERDRVRSQIHNGFDRYKGKGRVGIALTFGYSPDYTEGNAIAAEVNRVLLAELPEIFDRAVFEDFHWISSSAERGQVRIRAYLLLRAQ